MILRITWICAVLALVGVAGANVADLARTHPPAPIEISGAQTDPVMRAQERFARVRAALQVRGIRGHIGYYSDVAADRLSATPRGIERYFLAQFALAPLVLDGDGHDEWIVTDFEQVGSSTRIPAGWTQTADCGHGVFLLQRKP